MTAPRTAPDAPAAARRLIVTADDFGVNIAVNEAVEEAHRHGILTCASLMMNAAATQDAIARARRLPSLAVGLHVTLADGLPTSPAHKVKSLLTPEGRFRDDLGMTGLRWFINPLVRQQLAFEINSQFKAFAATGLVLDHVNVHKHLHLHPTVSSLLIHIGRRYGMFAVRVPEEPQRVIQEAEPGKELPRSLLGPVIAILRRRAKRANMITNDAVFGLAWSGAITEERLLALIPHLPPGLNELYAHPATREAAEMPHAVLEYRYRDELHALTSPRVRAALEERQIKLTRYSSHLPDVAGRATQA